MCKANAAADNSFLISFIIYFVLSSKSDKGLSLCEVDENLITQAILCEFNVFTYNRGLQNALTNKYHFRGIWYH